LQAACASPFIPNVNSLPHLQYVFGILGQDLTGIPTSLASVGQFSSDTNGNLNNGYDDEFFGGFFSGLETTSMAPTPWIRLALAVSTRRSTFWLTAPDRS